MTDLRTIVAAVISGAPFPSKRSYQRADDALDAIEAAGYRILGPDEVDQETLERAAEVAANWGSEIPAEIRALGRKA